MQPPEHSTTGAEQAAFDLLQKINDAILFPLITLLLATAFLVFLWGGFEYVRNSDNEAGREKGRTHLLFGTIGMLVMLSAYAILDIAAGTFGLDNELYQASDNRSPFAPSTSVRPQERPSAFPTQGESGQDTVGETGTPTTGETGQSSSGESSFPSGSYEASYKQVLDDMSAAGLDFTQRSNLFNSIQYGATDERRSTIESAYNNGYISAQSYDFLLDDL